MSLTWTEKVIKEKPFVAKNISIDLFPNTLFGIERITFMKERSLAFSESSSDKKSPLKDVYLFMQVFSSCKSHPVFTSCRNSSASFHIPKEEKSDPGIVPAIHFTLDQKLSHFPLIHHKRIQTFC